MGVMTSSGPQNLESAISMDVPAVLLVFKKMNLYLWEMIMSSVFGPAGNDRMHGSRVRNMRLGATVNLRLAWARAHNCRALYSGMSLIGLLSRELLFDIVDKLAQHLVGLLSDDRLPELPDLAQDADIGLHVHLGLFGA